VNRRDALIERVTQGYVQAFGAEPDHVFAAPGRVNLIGEHVDYNEGIVLPCAIDREIMVAIGPGHANLIDAAAIDLGNMRHSFEIGGDIPRGQTGCARGQGEWTNHLRGVAHFLTARGIDLRSMRVAIAGDVPMGAGLSSSAALGVALALAFSSYCEQPLQGPDLAKVAQAAENTFVGTACGIMDQMASACSRADNALMLDCRSLGTAHIPMPAGLALVIIDSGVRHSLGDSPYNERRAQCEAAARHYGVSSLRDLSSSQLEAERAGLGDAEFRRARHIVTEIARVQLFAGALERGATQEIAELMAASFRSYRDDFEASVPQVDQLFALVSEVLGETGGVRLTGGGFGGSLVALAPPEALADINRAIESRFNPGANAKASASIFRASGGAGRVF
jgi:galactokinase